MSQQLNYQSGLLKFLSAITTLGNEIDYDDLTVHHLKVLLLVARSTQLGTPLDGSQIAEELGLTKSGVSRALASLGKEGRKGSREGLNLLQTELDPNDRRRKLVTPTARGTNIIRKVIDILYAED